MLFMRKEIKYFCHKIIQKYPPYLPVLGVHTLVRQWKVNLSLINPEMATAVTSWRTDQPKQVPPARQSREDAHMPDVEFKITKKDRSQLTGKLNH